MSVGRTIPFTPLGGRYGYVYINGVRLNVASWSPQQNTNMLPVTNFNSPQDGNGNPHAEVIPSVVNTTFSVTGVRDASAQGFQPTAGDSGTGILGYNANLYYDIEFAINQVGGDCNIEGASGVTFTITANGIAVINGANGGA